MVEIAADRGYEEVTVRGLGRLAGISTGTFYKHFPNALHCFGHTYEWLMRSSLRRARLAWARGADWETGVRAALLAVLDDLSRHPKAAQLVLVEVYAAGPPMQARIRKEVAAFEELLGSRRAQPADVAAPIRRGIAAGVLRVARTRLLSGQLERLRDDADELGDWIVSLSSQPLTELDSPAAAEIAAERQRRRQEDLHRAIRGAPGDESGRVLAAVVKLSAAGGFAYLTVPRIRAEAGVSRRHLNDRFAGTEGCFLAAIEAIAGHATKRAALAADMADDWTAGVDAAIRSLCEEIACNPALAHLVFVEILAPGRSGLLCREQLVSIAAARLQLGSRSGRRPSPLVAEASSAAVWRILRSDVAARRAGATPRLAPLLLQLSLAPAAVAGPARIERH